MGQNGYTDLPWTKPNAKDNVFLHEDRLTQPVRWTRPRRIFVNSMSDLFHELVPYGFVDKVFAAMSLSPQHTFQILTKRPERMRDYLNDEETRTRVEMAMDVMSQELHGLGQFLGEWPLPNVWLGTSVEDQRAADERIPHLLRTPGAVRFLSCEPLIGPVDLDLESIHWVIVGGESGPGHRPIQAGWVRGIRGQTEASGVAFFFKQWGGLRPKSGGRELDGCTYDEMPDTYLTRA